MKKVYMMTDLEGVAGVDQWDPRHADYAVEAKGVHERFELQRLLTGEVVAAVNGLFDAGVEEVLVNDGHGAGRTILPEEMPAGVRLARGKDRPGWAMGLDDSFEAVVQVGMHAMSNTPMACLAHTMSSKVIDYYRVNEKDVGEMELFAFTAGELGIPWIYTSGDLHACREAESWVEGISTAAVKEGMGIECAIHLAPVEARALIRRTIAEAVKTSGSIQPLVCSSPVSLEVRQRHPTEKPISQGGEQVDELTVRFEGQTFTDVFKRYRRYATGAG